MDEEQKGVITDDGSDNTEKNEDLSSETLMVQKKKMREQRDEARARAEQLSREKAELEAKLADAEKGKTQVSSDVQEELTEVKFAIAHKDLDAADIAEAVVLAKARNKPLPEIYEDPLFQLYLKDKKEKQVNDIPTTNRSPKATLEQSFNSPLTDEEHKALWKKAVGLK